MSTRTCDFDVVILGGGLAGLTLTRQLLRKRPDTRVAIIEKRSFPVTEAAYKVGESTVEIGAHYLGQQLSLKKHLVDDQLPKFGLRFFFNNGQKSISDATEVGASDFFAAPGYQVDRGRLENHLAETVAELGAKFLPESQVRSVELAPGDEPHTVEYQHAGDENQIKAGWVVDASGRAGFLKKKLGLAQEIDHNVNAVWFRIGAQLRIDEWCDEPEWRSRVGKVPRRWLSTNHLLGKGYWVWIIPLASNSTSIGIVADPRYHPLSEINQFESALNWLSANEPMLAEFVEAHRDQLQDFLALKRLGFSCKQVFSEDRWALTGEAGVFLDPLYSPGIDYIAMGNTMICSLVERDMAGEAIDQLAPRLQSTFLTLFQNNLLSYQDQYHLFGNPRVMSLKYVWDYAVYWSFPALLYFNEKLTDAFFIQSISKGIQEIRDLNVRMQEYFRQWNAVDSGQVADAVFVDQHEIAILKRLNAELRERLDDTSLRTRFSNNVETLRDLFHEITSRIGRVQPALREIEQAAAPKENRLDEVFAALNL